MRLLRLTFCALVLGGCYSSDPTATGEDPGGVGGDDDALDWGTHAGGDDGVPYLGGPSDEDGDGVGDDFDSGSGSSQRATRADDFDSGELAGWSEDGGEWGLTDEGEVVQTRTCHDDQGLLLSADGLDLADVYVRADIRPLDSPGCGLASFAPGLFVRGSGGRYLACTIGLDRQYGTFLDLVRFDGREERLDEASSEQIHDGWLTMELAADGSDVTCRAVGLMVQAYDTEETHGSAGLYSRESPALFDNFAAFALPD